MHLTNIADLSKFPDFLKKWKKKSVIKFLWNLKGFQIAKTISKKNKIRDLMLPVFKTHYKAIAIKTVWYWHTNRYINQWNKIEIP